MSFQDSPLQVHSTTRLLYLQCAATLVLSLVLGSAFVLQFGFRLRKFGGVEYVPRVLALAATRTLGAGVAATALLYALLLWTHRTSPESVRKVLLRATPAALGFTVLALPVAIALILASGYATAALAYGVQADPSTLVSTLTPPDAAAAYWSLVQNAVVVAAFCWFAVPLMSQRSWLLPQKLGATLAAFFFLRLVAEMFAL